MRTVMRMVMVIVIVMGMDTGIRIRIRVFIGRGLEEIIIMGTGRVRWDLFRVLLG